MVNRTSAIAVQKNRRSDGEEGARAGQVVDAPEAGRVDRDDPVRPVGQVEPGPEEVVAVARDLGQDLAEAERDDREVVAAQPERGQADEDPDERGDDAREREQEPDRDVDAGDGRGRPRRPRSGRSAPANWLDANQATV